MANALYINNDNLLVLDGLKDTYPGQTGFINDATVTADVIDPAGTTIESGISLDYITGSDGKYVGVIEDDVLTTTGQHTCTVTVDAGNDKIAEFNLEVRPEERGTT